jgi:DNA-binding transcriptional ArsR family regulator
VLDDDALSISQLASELGADRRTVTRHVRALERLGLVAPAPGPGGALAYRVVTAPYYTDAAWSDLPTPAKRATMVAALLHAHSIASAAAAEGGFDRDDMHYTRSSLTVDERGWSALSRAFEALFDQMEAIEKDSAERLRAGEGEPIEVGSVLMLFERLRSHGAHADDCEPSEEGLEHAYSLSESLHRALIGDRVNWAEVEDTALQVERLAHQLRLLARDRVDGSRGRTAPA